MPDISSKDKAQEYIGLDMKKFKSEKENWIKNTPPTWLEKAKQEGKIVASR